MTQALKPGPDNAMSMRIRRIASFVSNHSKAILFLGAAIFLLPTVPSSKPDIFARSEVQADPPANGIVIRGRSLLATETAPGLLDITSFRRGGFSVVLLLTPAMTGDSHIGSIVSMSDSRNYNWAIEQHGRAIRLVHRNRTVEFTDVIRPGVQQRLTATFDIAAASLWIDGAFVAAKHWTAGPAPWSETARLTIANTMTGDYPWQGVIHDLTVYVGIADTAAVEQSSDTGDPDSDVTVPYLELEVGPTGDIMLRGPISKTVPIEVVVWPWTLKLRQVAAGSYAPASAPDIVANLLLTIVLGLGLASVVGRPRFASVAATIGITFTISTVVEGLQLFAPHRVASIQDVLLNTAGAALGCLLWIFVDRQDQRSAAASGPAEQ
jgi:hypothetical protein